MSRRRWAAIAFGALGLAAATLVLAGSAFSVKCTTPGCGFADEVSFGGGFQFGQVTGYCTVCKEFVYLTWDRPRGNGEKPGTLQKAKPDAKPEPKPLGQVWSPASGQIRPLYTCPKCAKPFMAIQDSDDLKYCPKCQKPSLKVQRTVMYD